MKQNISSRWTLPTKIFNFLMAALPIALILTNFQMLIAAPLSPGEVMGLALALLWTGFFLWINSRLKFIGVDENNLYVSRLFVEKTIPLAEVKDVFLTTIGYIWVGISFHSKTAFGNKIFFMPRIVKSFVFSMQRYHPVVEELKALTTKRASG